MKATRAPTIRRADHLAWRTVEGEVIVLHLRTRTAFGLDEAAGGILELLGRPREVEDLVRSVASDPGAVEAFLERALEAGLFVGSTEPAQPIGPRRAAWGSGPSILWEEPLPAAVAQGTPPMMPSQEQCL